MNFQLPPFDALPLQKGGPHGNAWGLFGSEDQLGRLNLLTPSTTKSATSEIVEGIRVSTDWPLNRMTQPFFGRAAFSHTVKNKAPRSVNDDSVAFNTQISSQWDGFRHYGYQAEKVYFGGKTLENIMESDINGIHAWSEKGGIVGRGVLLDYETWARSNGKPLAAFETTTITLADLKAVAADQGTTFKQGDILLLRSGWGKAYAGLDEAQITALAAYSATPAIGVESSEDMLRWIWDTGFAAVAGDMPSFEAWPCQDERFWLHEWLLAGWGCPIGELFDLEALARECRRLKRWTFFFSSMPLKVPGGVASPPNSVAIL